MQKRTRSNNTTTTRSSRLPVVSFQRFLLLQSCIMLQLVALPFYLLSIIPFLPMTSSFHPMTMPISTRKLPHQQQEKVLDPTFVLKLSPESSNHDRFDSSTMTTTKATVASSDASSTVSEESDMATKSLQQTLNVESSPLQNKRPWIVGHRGCLYDELENTREGFQRTAEMGADAVELDVFLLKCGTLIVFHGGGTDENPGHLLDYCGVDKGILDLDYSEALKLQFNPNFDEFGCPAEKTLSGWIPTLEQVLMDAKESGLHVKVELKGPGTVEPTLEVVERLGMESQVSYASFDKERIAHLRNLRPDKGKYPTGALFNDVPDDYLVQAEKAGATEIHLRYDTCTKDIISRIHNAGYGTMAWFRGPIGMASDCRQRFWDVGNEDESMYDALLRTGVQQMCVNKPDVLVQYRKQLLKESGEYSDDFFREQWIRQSSPQ